MMMVIIQHVLEDSDLAIMARLNMISCEHMESHYLQGEKKKKENLLQNRKIKAGNRNQKKKKNIYMNRASSMGLLGMHVWFLWGLCILTLFFFNGGMISVFQRGNFDFISFAAPELVF